jgi:hypothetical protein
MRWESWQASTKRNEMNPPRNKCGPMFKWQAYTRSTSHLKFLLAHTYARVICCILSKFISVSCLPSRLIKTVYAPNKLRLHYFFYEAIKRTPLRLNPIYACIQKAHLRHYGRFKKSVCSRTSGATKRNTFKWINPRKSSWKKLCA